MVAAWQSTTTTFTSVKMGQEAASQRVFGSDNAPTAETSRVHFHFRFLWSQQRSRPRPPTYISPKT
jgi:hypothetical protein